MRKIPIHFQVIIGLLAGAGYAWLSIRLGWNEFTIDYIKPIGDVFITLLKLIAVPLVLFSIISGVASLGDVRKLGKLGLRTMGLFLSTTIFAVSLGLLLVNLFKPGEYPAEETRLKNRISYELWAESNGIPQADNLCFACDVNNRAIAAEIQSSKPEAGPDWVSEKLANAEKIKQQQTDAGPLKPILDVVPVNIIKSMSDMDMLQIIFFAIFFGVILVSLPELTRNPVVQVISGLNEVFVRMVWVLMKAMPVFVFALMAGQIVVAAGSDPDRFFSLLDFLMRYSVVVVLGIFILLFGLYPVLVALFVKDVGYKGFLSAMRDAQITAFSTSSSLATLPVTMDCVHNKLKVSSATTGFVLPIGATVNMDGTSLYMGAATVALAQFHMVDLTLTQQAVIVVTATLGSIGAAAIPSAGLVMMIMVLESVGLSPAWIAIIFPVDRILDMFRTVANVTSDATVALIVDRTISKKVE